MRAPSSVSPPKTGSRGSSALAPATISTSAPSRLSAVNASATTRAEPPACRDQCPLPPRVALHLAAVSHDRRGQPLAGFLLVQVQGLDHEQVDFLPRGLEQDLRRGRGEPRALLDRDLSGRVTDVVAEHLVDQALEGRCLAPLSDRFHWSGGRELGSDRGWPETGAAWLRSSPRSDREGPETGASSRRGFVLM